MKPSATEDIKNVFQKLKIKQPFCFIRFSDGEVEIIKNRYLKIYNGKTHFKGKFQIINFLKLIQKSLIH